MKKIKTIAKKLFGAKRMKTLAMMLLCGTIATYAQNAAGDYTAGTDALATVTEEIAKYVPFVVKLCYAIAGVVAVVGAISVYIATDLCNCAEICLFFMAQGGVWATTTHIMML